MSRVFSRVLGLVSALVVVVVVVAAAAAAIAVGILPSDSLLAIAEARVRRVTPPPEAWSVIIPRDREFGDHTNFSRYEWPTFYSYYLSGQIPRLERPAKKHLHRAIFWLSIVYCKELVRLNESVGRCQVNGYEHELNTFEGQKVLRNKFDYFLRKYDKVDKYEGGVVNATTYKVRLYNLRGVVFSLRLMLANLYLKALGKRTEIGTEFDSSCDEMYERSQPGPSQRSTSGSGRRGTLPPPPPLPPYWPTSSETLDYVSECFYNASRG